MTMNVDVHNVESVKYETHEVCPESGRKFMTTTITIRSANSGKHEVIIFWRDDAIPEVHHVD